MKSFKRIIPVLVLALVAAVILMTAAPLMASHGGGSTYKVVAWNDLGMHCACPSFAGFLLLPPFNTVRAQVIQYGTRDPIFVSQSLATSLGLSVTYSMVEDTDTNLPADPYFSQWIIYGPKLLPGYVPIVGGKVMGITTPPKGLSGTMDYNSDLLDWTAVGIPAYPIHTGNPALDVMTDPLFTTQTSTTMRDPYLTANVYVKDSGGNVLAQTSTVVPVAFGGCCGCHLDLAASKGYPRTPAGSFSYMGKLHSTITLDGTTIPSKVDFNYLDPDGDGVAGPVRCSVCHWDPAMGESAAPGFLDSNGNLQTKWANLKLLPGAPFQISDLKVSSHSFSEVVHLHVKDTNVLLMDSAISTDCYKCHPGNGINCYRGAHFSTNTGINCYDCHGNLNQRVATGQLSNPWQVSTLPSCISTASTGSTPAFTCHSASVVGGTTYPATPPLFGKFINSRGHKGSPKCQTCHGSAHAEAPSAMSLDNVQLQNLQGTLGADFSKTNPPKNSSYALGVCFFCHPGKANAYGVPPHN